MATAYTQPTQYKAPIKQWDTDLIGKALAYKQQTYDINKEKVQQFYNQLTTVELAKGGDREHLESRLNLLNQQVTQAGGMGDLSQSGAFDAISSYYGQAIDEKVENGYYGTLVGKKIKAEAEQAEKDGKYNDLNLEYSMQDYAKWVNDGQVGSEYRGNSKYVPYTDKMAVIQKAFKDVDPDIKIVQTSTGYQFLNKKYEEVSPETVRSIMQNIVLSNPGVAQQIKVDAWSTFRGVDDTKALDVTNNLYENRIEQIDEAIKQTNVKLKSKPNDKELKAELQQYEKLKTDTSLELTNYNANFSKNPSYYKEQYEANNLIQGAIGMYAKSNLIDISSITDQGALERLKHSNALSEIRAKGNSDRITEAQKAFATDYQNDQDASNLASVYDAFGIGTGVYYRGEDGKPVEATFKQMHAGLDKKNAISLDQKITAPNLKGHSETEGIKLKKNEFKKEELSLKLQAQGMLADKVTAPSATIQETKNALYAEMARRQQADDLTTKEKEKFNGIIKKLDDNQYNQKIYSAGQDQGLQAILEDAKNNPGKVYELDNGETVYFDRITGSYAYQNRRTVSEAVPLKEIAKDLSGITGLEAYINAAKTLAANTTLIQPFFYRRNPNYVNKINTFLTEGDNIDPSKLSNRNQDKLEEIRSIRNRKSVKSIDDISDSEAEDILSYLNDFEADEALYDKAQYKINNLTPSRENEGLPIYLNEEETLNKLREKLDNNTLGEGNTQIVNSRLAELASKGDLPYSQAIRLSPTNDSKLGNAMNAWLGTAIDFKDKDSYRNIGVEKHGDNIEVFAEVYDKDAKEFLPYKEKIGVEQAIQVEQIKNLIEVGLQDDREKMLEVAQKSEIKSYKIVAKSENENLNLPIYTMYVGDDKNKKISIRLKDIGNDEYTYDVTGETGLEDEIFKFFNKNYVTQNSLQGEIYLLNYMLEKYVNEYDEKAKKAGEKPVNFIIESTPYNKYQIR